jgi:hypothetical protein
VAVMDDSGGHGYREVAKGSGPIVAAWPAERAQVIKIVCNSQEDFYWWSITDLTITAADIVEEPPVVPPIVPPVEPPVVPPVVPPVEPPPIDGEDVTVGPAAYNEAQARWWLLYWAAKFNWPVRQRDEVHLGDGIIAVYQSVEYVTLKARDRGILSPFPFI